MFESQLVQMPGPRDIILYWPGPRAFSVVQKPRGWAHISVQKPRGARGGMVTGQIDTCITALFTVTSSSKFFGENSKLLMEPERAWQNKNFLN